MKNVYFPDQKLMSSNLVREFSTNSASRLHKKGGAFSHGQRLAAASSIFSLIKKKINKFFCIMSDEDKRTTDNVRQKQNNSILLHRCFWSSINSRYNRTSNGCQILRFKTFKDHNHYKSFSQVTRLVLYDCCWHNSREDSKAGRQVGFPENCKVTHF